MPAIKIKYREKDEENFFETLNGRVDKYFESKGISKFANAQMVFKTIILLISAFGTYALIMSDSFSPPAMLGLAVLFNFSSALIAMNIGHDAGHGSYSKNPKVNKLLTLTLNLVGTNSYIYNLKHTISHHTFPNVPGKDGDIIQTNPIIRVSPNAKLKWYHRYQHLFAPILYLFYTFFLVLIKDFMMFMHKDIGNKINIKHPLREWIILFAGKAFYVTYVLVLPIIFLTIPWWYVIVGFLLMHFVTGWLYASILIPAHLVEGTTFPVPDDNGVLENSWARQQVETTIDFARKSKLANWLFGGLNTNVIHHLYPEICHVHFIGISKIVKQTTKEFGINYMETTWLNAIRSHFRFLKLAGSNEKFYSFPTSLY
ncbi:MAG: acyl-CoA desaturase [Bacteroidetes bacterium]|nr:acyl-CoA desaturase [Bacteroidota bacterium]